MKNTIKIGLVAIVFSTAALAHEGATGIVKDRMDAMSAIGKSTKSIAAMVSGKTVYDAQAVKDAAETIATHAETFIDKFPKGSANHISEAAPAIWDKPEEFAQETQKLVDYANALAALANNGNGAELKTAFTKVGSTCKSCHQTFRIKK